MRISFLLADLFIQISEALKVLTDKEARVNFLFEVFYLLMRQPDNATSAEIQKLVNLLEIILRILIVPVRRSQI